MLAELSGNIPRVIALIDLPDLQRQVKRIGGAFVQDVTAVIEQLEAGVAKLNPVPGVRLPLGIVYVYSPLEGRSGAANASEDEVCRRLARTGAAEGSCRSEPTVRSGGRGFVLQQPVRADRPGEGERVVFRQLAARVKRECSGSCGECTHCQGGTTDLGGQGRDNPIASDLLELAREDEYDWAVVVSTDLLLIPVVRYLQSHGRKIVHACFPPVAMDLTKECWASIDLRQAGLGGNGVAAR